MPLDESGATLEHQKEVVVRWNVVASAGPPKQSPTSPLPASGFGCIMYEGSCVAVPFTYLVFCGTTCGRAGGADQRPAWRNAGC